MPIQLGSVSVKVNGKPGYISFYCGSATSNLCTVADQINVLTPLDSTVGASVEVVVTNATTASLPFTVNMRALSPAFLTYGGNGYIVATHPNYSLVGPTTLYPGYSTPAQPGETIVVYAIGFGLPVTPIVDGASTQSGALAAPLPDVKIGGVPAAVTFAGLISPGLYQLNIVVPSTGLTSGDNTVTCTYAGASIPPGALITIQR